ncbi:MAG: hypothetical protein WDO72_11800 [Pseudomonadota bacterium]
MNAKRVALTAFSGLFAFCAGAREPDVSGLRAWSLPEYTVVTHDPKAVGWVAQRTPIVDQLLVRLLETDKRRRATPTYIFVVRKSLWQDCFQVSDAMVSEFAPARFANYLLIGAPPDEYSVTGAVAHEYSHYFLHTQFHGGFPLWFDEGLATLVTFTQVWRGIVTVRNPYFGEHLSRRIPMERLLRIDKSSPEYLNMPTASGVHEQSWGIVHKGLIDDLKFGSRMFAYLKAVDDLQPIDAAVPEYFKMSVSELDAEITRYLHQWSFARAEFSYRAPRSVAAGAGRALGEREALEMIAGVMLDTALDAGCLAASIDAAQKRAPNAASVQVLRMRMAARARDDATLSTLLLTLGNETQDAAVARGAGLALFERVREERDGGSLTAAQRQAWSAAALEMLDRSLAANPDDVEAAWSFGVLSARLERDRELALRRLQRASELMPGNADLAKARLELYEGSGQSEQTIALLNEIAAFTDSAEVRQWAKKRIAAAKVGQ